MKVKNEITLDFGEKSNGTVYAKQGDADTRDIVIYPVFRGVPLMIGDGVTARILLTKPDGHTVFDDAEIEDGVIAVTLTAQSLACDGIAVAEISLYEGETVLTSTSFDIDIERLVFDSDAVESSDEYGTLVSLIASAEEAISDAEEAAEAAGTAAETVNAAVTKIDGMTVSASTLEPGEDAYVTKTLAEGAYSLEFGIPKGEKGDVYFASFTVDVATGKLYMNKENELHGINFAVADGYLEVII